MSHCGLGTTVAVVEQGRYPFAVRHPIFQSCVLILLLVVRLLFGEVAHATPHQMMITGSATAPLEHLTGQQNCPDHASHTPPTDLAQNESGHAPGASPHHATSPDTPASHDRVVAETSSDSSHCCEVGECECLCVHISVAAASCLVMELTLTSRSSIASRTVGLIQSRPSLLFRPPAA